MIPSQLTVLIEATVRALIAALAVWGVMRLLRIRNVLAQKAAWGLLLIAALAMPLLMRWQSVPTWAAVNLPTPSWTKLALAKRAAPTLLPTPAPTVYRSPSGEPETITQPLPEATDHFPAPAVPDDEIHAPPMTAREAAPIPAPVATKPATPPAASPVSMSTARLLLAIAWILYLGVCAVLLLRLVWGLASSLRLWMEATAIETAPDLDLPDSVPVRWSPRIASPVNIGSGILLPADYVEWDEEKLRVVIAHERSHIHQRDFYLQFVAGALIPAELQDAMSREAQAERERRARIILGTAETEIAEKFGQAALTYQHNPVALHLRAMNMLYEAIKEKGAMVVVPSSAVETMGLGGMLGTVSMGGAKPQ